jgi:DNA-3-methyladenine glycosylase
MSVLPAAFFDRPVLEVAPDLLGKYLVRRMGGEDIALMITEVEAYDGPEDLACHARAGKTARTEVMFGPPGQWYVYLIYGMYWMLNIVVEKEGYPAAVLIRGTKEVIGPGRLTEKLQIDKTLNNLPASPESGLWIEDRGIVVPSEYIQKTPRIGVDYAGPVWATKPYRFALEL